MPDIKADIDKPVVKTVKVKYSLAPSQDISGLWQWFIAYHVNDETGEEPYTWAGNKDDDGNGTRRYFFVKKWSQVGRHMVRCAKRRTTSEGKSTKEIIDTAEHEQIVVDEGAFLKDQMKRSKN